MPSSFSSFTTGDIIQATHAAEMHAPIQNLERGASFYAGASAGTSTAYTVSLSPAPDSPYVSGMIINFKAHVANAVGSPNVTLNANSGGAKPIVKNGGDALAAADLKAGQIVSVIFDAVADRFNLLSVSSSSGLVSLALGGSGRDNSGSNVGLGTLPSVSGAQNTWMGAGAAGALTSGSYNTCLGNGSGAAVTTGNGLTAVGFGALPNTTSGYSLGVGYYAGYNNTSGTGVFLGQSGGFYNTTGTDNVCVGSSAGGSNSTGSYRTCVGGSSGGGTADAITAIGFQALSANTGSYNTALGMYAGSGNTTGQHNIFMGYNCAANLTTGSDNIMIGYGLSAASATDSNQISIGDAFRRSGARLASSVTSKAQSYSSSSTTNILSLTSRRGRIEFFDSNDDWAIVRFLGTGTPVVESGSGAYVVSASPSSAQIGLNVSGSNLQMILGSGAVRSISFQVKDHEF
jgi:hypothetical protein